MNRKHFKISFWPMFIFKAMLFMHTQYWFSYCRALLSLDCTVLHMYEPYSSHTQWQGLNWWFSFQQTFAGNHSVNLKRGLESRQLKGWETIVKDWNRILRNRPSRKRKNNNKTRHIRQIWRSGEGVINILTWSVKSSRIDGRKIAERGKKKDNSWSLEEIAKMRVSRK